MSIRETVLNALHASLGTIGGGVVVQRNAMVPEKVPAAGLIIMRDGDPGEPEVTLSPLRYHYQHMAEIEVLVRDGSAVDARFDTLCASIGAALGADRTLGGTCDWVEAQAPSPVDVMIDGGPGIKAAILKVELDYTTADPLG